MGVFQILSAGRTGHAPIKGAPACADDAIAMSTTATPVRISIAPILHLSSTLSTTNKFAQDVEICYKLKPMIKLTWTLLTAMVLSAASTDSKGEKEVMAAMDAWKQATMKKDGAALGKLLHPDLTYSHSSGKNETKADVLKSVTAGKATVEAIDFSDTTVRVYGNTALVRGKVDIRNNTAGKSTTANLNILHVWVKGPQGWQMVARQATRLAP
jgi:ketosteroid isomerase-like protein